MILGRLGDSETAGSVCGERFAQALFPIENAREDAEQYHRFRIESEDLMRAEHAARAQGKDVLGCYHSHPDHPARPSDYDREHALPFYSYIITAVEQGKAALMTSWVLADDRSVFIEEKIGV